MVGDRTVAGRSRLEDGCGTDHGRDASARRGGKVTVEEGCDVRRVQDSDVVATGARDAAGHEECRRRGACRCDRSCEPMTSQAEEEEHLPVCIDDEVIMTVR